MSPQPLHPGQEVDHYTLLREIGAGGMGVVWLARDSQLGRRVALKVLSADTDSDRLLQEAQLTARVNHPNLVTVYGVGRLGAQHYLALEYVEGADLRQWASPPLPLREAARVLAGVAAGVAALHEAGVLHLDLKPHNVLVGPDGRPRVADLGLARQVEDARASRSGTPGYVAPEVWRREAPDDKADVWALGVMLYELLTGRRPYQRLEHSTRMLAEHVAAPDPVELPGETLEISALLASCLAKDPGQRPTASQLEKALRGSVRSAHLASAESPFVGLRTLTREDAGLLLGRQAELDRIDHLLRSAGALVLAGATGAGKSSLVLAGVLPRLAERGPVLPVVLRPGPRPLQALREAVDLQLSTTSSASTAGTLTVEGWEEEDDDGAGEWVLHLMLLELARRSRRRVVLVVDQLEEVFTLCDSPSERAALLAMLGRTGEDPGEPVRALYTVREDYLARVLQGMERQPTLVLVHAPEPAALRRDLAQLPEAFGARFEDAQLVSDIVDEVLASSAPLAMLQFGGQRLWEAREGEVMTRAAHTRLGGLAGVLSRHADEVVSGLDESGRELARLLLLRLVNADGTRRPLARSALLDGLYGPAEAVLEVLLQGRLVVGTTRGEEALVELAHESLVRSWPTMQTWLASSHAHLQVLREVEVAAEQWRRRSRPREMLWTGEALQEAERALARLEPAEVPSGAQQFLQESAAARALIVRTARRRSTLALGGAMAVTISAVAAAVLIGQARGEAEEAARSARRHAAEAEAAAARGAQRDGRLAEARARLRASLELADTPLARGVWWTLESARLQQRVPLPRGHARALGPADQWLAGGNDGSLVLIDPITGFTRDLPGLTDAAGEALPILQVESTPSGRLALSSQGSVFDRPTLDGTDRPVTLPGQAFSIDVAGETLGALLETPTGPALARWSDPDQVETTALEPALAWYHLTLLEGWAGLRTRRGRAGVLAPGGAPLQLLLNMEDRIVDGLIRAGEQLVAIGRGSCPVVGPDNHQLEALPCPALGSFGAATEDTLLVQGRTGGLWHVERSTGEVTTWDAPFAYRLGIHASGDVGLATLDELQVHRPGAALEGLGITEPVERSGHWRLLVEEDRWIWASPEVRRTRTATEALIEEQALTGDDTRPALASGPDGQLATSAGGEQIWTSHAEKRGVKMQQYPVQTLAGRGEVLLVAAKGSQVRRMSWEGDDLLEQESWRIPDVTALDISTDGAQYWAGTRGGYVARWGPELPLGIWTRAPGWVRDVGISEGGRLAALTEEGVLLLGDDRQREHTVSGWMPRSALLWQGETLLVQDEAGALVRLDAQGERMEVVTPWLPPLADLAQADDGVVAVDQWGQLHAWSVPGWLLRETAPTTTVSVGEQLASAASPDGTWAGLSDGRLLRQIGGEWIEVGTTASQAQVTQVEPGPPGLVVVATAASTVELWHDEGRVAHIDATAALHQVQLTDDDLVLTHADGSTRRLDLSIFSEEDCALSARWTASLPLVWREGRLQPATETLPARCAP